MKIEFIFIGKTTEPYLNEGITTYLKRLVNYLPAEILTIPASSSRVINDSKPVTDEVKQKVHYTLSASKFTFTHQMIRLLLTEQVYRAMTILKNESYHHD